MSIVVVNGKNGNPPCFMNRKAINREDIADAKQIFGNYTGDDVAWLDAMVRLYEDLRTGLLRNTAAYNANLCLDHEAAIAEVVKAYGCDHAWDNTTIRRAANNVLGTSTVYTVDTCSNCGEKRESVQHNQSQTGD